MTRESFKILFENHFDTIRNYLYYRTGNEELATDIAQETFLIIWEKQLLKSENNSTGLLYKIASDILVNKYRRQQVELKFQRSTNPEVFEHSPEEELQYNELHAKYEMAISKLGEKQRTVFLMSRNDELKYSEIALRLNLSEKAVEKRMSQAIAYLKTEMSEYFQNK